MRSGMTIGRVRRGAPLGMACAILLLGAGEARAQGEAKVVRGPTSPELVAAVVAADSTFFRAMFDDCDLVTLGATVTDDFEFYHDVGGRTARTRREFVDAIAGLCERQRAGTDYRARRELVRDSLVVYPVPGFGAIATGVHRFHRRDPGKPERFVEVARFTIVWQQEGGRWRMARALSYDHRRVE
jgi:hypothetical protein